MESGAMDVVVPKCRMRKTSDHQLFRRHGNLRRHSHGQCAHTNEAVRVLRPASWNGRRRSRRKWKITPRTSWRISNSRAVDWNDARILERSSALYGELLVAFSRRLGARRLGHNR